jgi:RND family efflux transporter MFP subunit
MNDKSQLLKSINMKKTMTGIFCAIVLLSCTQKKTVSESQDENTTSVKVMSITSRMVRDSIPVTGLLTTENEVRFSFKIPGIIDKIYVHEGEFVRAGQILAALKVTEINAQLEQANLSFEKAKRDHFRINNLYKDSVGTLEQLQNAKTTLDIARQSVDALSFNQQHSFIKAARDGFVTHKMANEGEIVSTGTPVLSINETDGNGDFLLQVGVTDKEWPQVLIGQEANVNLDAYGEKIFKGHVYRKSRTIDSSSGLFQIDITVRFNNESPADGMFGRGILISSGFHKQLILPYEALFEVSGDKATVLSPATENTLQKKEVTIKSFNKNYVVVKSGLQEGELVVVSNNAFLNEKSKIAIAK